MQLRSLCSFAKRRVREEYRKIDKLSHLKKDKTYILNRHRNKEKYLENDTSLQIIPSVHAIIPSVQKQELSNYLIESIEKIDPALRPTDLNVKSDTKKKFSRIEKYEGKLKKYLSPHRKLATDKSKSKSKDFLNIQADGSPKSESPSPKHESTSKRSIFGLRKKSKEKEIKKAVETPVEEITTIVKANSSEVISSSRSVTSSISANRILDLSPTNDIPIRQISSNPSTLKLPEINVNNKKIEEVLQEKVIMKGSNSKPPNILVYADSTVTRENVRKVLCRLLSKDKYTVYSVSSTKAWWGSQATLLVVCGSVSSQLNQLMLDYLLSGGQMLCLCSDFINTVLPTFTTAEVRERELVCFSYERWHGVRMIHHIFCYQPSPGRKLFSKDSSEEVSPSSSRSTMVSAVDIKDTRGISHTLHVSVLGTEDTWHTPSLLLAEVPASNGKAVFSQVHLELEPNQYEEDESIYAALKESDSARLGILKHLLENYLNVECGNDDGSIVYTSAYFLGLHELKLAMLSQLSTKLCGDVLNASKLQIQFYRKGTVPKVPTESFLPVLIHSCPERFSTVEYFDTIRTNQIGRLLIYSDILTSSMDVLDGCSLTHGLVVVSRQQTHGVGRSKNVWLSPEGCCMFSVQLHVPAASELGRRAPLVQLLVAVSIVSAIKSLPGYEALDVGLKWPNDIYVKGSVKIGGLIIRSVVDSSRIICNVGVGINLDNSAPTTCLNDLINEYNHMNSVNLKTLTLECFMASIFNELERIYTRVVNGDVEYLYEKYYQYWLHGNKVINVVTADGNSQQVIIEGIDDYGFLRVKNKDVTFTVHPDGNSFDMMVGLITPKTPTP